jgi:4-oxalocrotonate tautomerase family enzyme
MAVITVKTLRGYGGETKRKLAQALTAAASDALDVPRGEITVLIDEYASENWASGGELQSDRGKTETMAYDLEALFKKPSERPAEKKAAPKPVAKPAPAKASPRKATAKSRSRR